MLGVLEFGDYGSCELLGFVLLLRRVDVLTGNGETRDHVIFWQCELELLGVVVVVRNIDQLQGDKSLVATLESLLVTGGCFSVDIALVAEVGVSEETSTCRSSSYDPWRGSRRR